MNEVDFIGAGWAFPLGTDATGGVALVTREREIEQAIRLILGTARGERPMRPEFGCRIHDHVFGPANARHRRADRLRRARGAGALGAAHRRHRRRGELRPDRRGHALRRRRLLDPRAATTRATWCSRSTSSPTTNADRPGRTGPAEPEVLSHAARPEPRRPHVPGPGRRGEAAGPERCPEWTDHNVSDPGVTLIEAFAQMVDQLIYRLNRVPDLQLRQVPRADRCRAAAAGRGPRRRDVLAVGAAAAAGAGPRARPRWRRPRTDIHDPVVFSHDPGPATSCRARFARAGARQPVGAAPVDTDGRAAPGRPGFRCFSAHAGRRATRC